MIKIVEKVVLINTGELFDNIVEASKAKGVSYNKVYDSVHHRSKYSWASNGERLIWRFKSEYDNMPKDQIDELLAEINNLGKIILLNTGEQFNSVKEASKVTGISRTTIKNSLYNVNSIGGKIDGKGAVWVFKSKYNLLSKEDKERLLNYKEYKQVIDIYSGKVYNSLDELRNKIEKKRIQLFHLADTSIPLVYGSDKLFHVFMFKKEYDKLSNNSIKRLKDYIDKNTILFINENKKYARCTDITEITGISARNIGKCVSGEWSSVKWKDNERAVFIDLYTYKNMSSYRRRAFLAEANSEMKRGAKSLKPMPLIAIPSGIKFESLSKASRYYGLSLSMVHKSVYEHTWLETPSGNSVMFEKLEEE